MGFPYRYTARRLDPETGLCYYRARYSSAALGRFLQTDPIGYQDQMNLYGYVANDPLNATDPSGLWECGPQTDCDKVEQAIKESDNAIAGMDQDSQEFKDTAKARDAIGKRGDKGVVIEDRDLKGVWGEAEAATKAAPKGTIRIDLKRIEADAAKYRTDDPRGEVATKITGAVILKEANHIDDYGKGDLPWTKSDATRLETKAMRVFFAMTKSFKLNITQRDPGLVGRENFTIWCSRAGNKPEGCR